MLELSEDHILNKAVDVEVHICIKRERLFDLLVGALEGGSNYWYFITEFVNPHTADSASLEYETALPLVDGGALIICDLEEWNDYQLYGGERPKEYALDIHSMLEGLKVMNDEYPRDWCDFMNGDDDADTSDIYLQCCLFGEVIYG